MLHDCPSPAFSHLETARLALRPVQMDDADALHRLRSNALVNVFIDRTLETHPRETEDFIRKRLDDMRQHKTWYWVVCLHTDPAPIGTVCYWNLEPDRHLAELGYELHPDHQGKGFASEALAAVLRFGFEKMRLQAVTAFPKADNLASIRLLERHHFKLDTDGQWVRSEDVAGYLVYVLTLLK